MISSQGFIFVCKNRVKHPYMNRRSICASECEVFFPPPADQPWLVSYNIKVHYHGKVAIIFLEAM